jgi:hypothetical protein
VHRICGAELAERAANSILDARTELGNDLTPTLRRDVCARLPRLYVEARRAAVLGLEDYAEEEAARLLPEANPLDPDSPDGS